VCCVSLVALFAVTAFVAAEMFPIAVVAVVGDSSAALAIVVAGRVVAGTPAVHIEVAMVAKVADPIVIAVQVVTVMMVVDTET
jgi:hypothetical protein